MSGEEKLTGGEQAADQPLAKALHKLTPEQLAEVSPKFVRERYGPGEVIIRQEEMPDRFYIVIRGKAEVWHENVAGETEVVDVRVPGEFFGEIGVLQNRPRSATVRAPDDAEVEVLAMEREDFREMIEESKATEVQVAREMIRRLISLADAQP